jgi:UDP-glucose 4-epimerase
MDDTNPTLRNKRIIITGGCGFIGSHLVEALWRDNHVVVIDDLSAGSLSNISGFEAEFHRRDIVGTLDDLMAGADIVFHTAASVQVTLSVQDPGLDARTNIIGLLNVLNAARRSRIERLVFSSSTAVYGVAQYLPIDEAHPTEPISPYGLSKLTGERYFRMFHALEGLPAVCLRYFNVYGPRQRANSTYSGVISIFAQNVLRGQPSVIYGDGEQSRDFVNVKDVVQANLLAAVAPPARVVGKVFNVGTGRATNLKELVRLLGIAPGHVSHGPARAGDIRLSVAEIGLISRELGYRPRVSLEDGLKDYLAWRAADLASAPSGHGG